MTGKSFAFYSECLLHMPPEVAHTQPILKTPFFIITFAYVLCFPSNRCLVIPGGPEN
jgi:hypothetical protein